MRLGDVYPDFTMGINNTFTYKGVTLSFLIDIRHGGSLYSETVANLRSSGLAAETIAHREDASFIEPGVILQDDGTYRPNDVPVKSMQDYWQHISNSSNNEGNIYNASFVKLREVQLSYSFPRKWFKSFFVKSLDLGFEARNLWIIKDQPYTNSPDRNVSRFLQCLAVALLTNLLKNAFVHNIDGGHIRITVTKNGITFRNSGVEHPLNKEHIFERFYQGSKKEGSTGLGLAIADSICRLQHLNIKYYFEQNEHCFEISQS